MRIQRRFCIQHQRDLLQLVFGFFVMQTHDDATQLLLSERNDDAPTHYWRLSLPDAIRKIRIQRNRQRNIAELWHEIDSNGAPDFGAPAPRQHVSASTSPPRFSTSVGHQLGAPGSRAAVAR